MLSVVILSVVMLTVLALETFINVCRFYSDLIFLGKARSLSTEKSYFSDRPINIRLGWK
jgi:hypothetical protein